jgi:hypothetical protein
MMVPSYTSVGATASNAGHIGWVRIWPTTSAGKPTFVSVYSTASPRRPAETRLGELGDVVGRIWRATIVDDEWGLIQRQLRDRNPVVYGLEGEDRT